MDILDIFLDILLKLPQPLMELFFLQSWLQGLPEDFTVCLFVSGPAVLATRST